MLHSTAEIRMEFPKLVECDDCDGYGLKSNGIMRGLY